VFGEHIERAKRQKLPAFAGKVARPERFASKSPTSGFTLTELLVAAAMISILGVLLIPALSTANDTSKAAVCLGNMHQWGLAVSMYCEDWNDYFPREGFAFGDLADPSNLGAWYNVWPRYVNQPRLMDLYIAGNPPKAGVKSIWICPSATNTTYSPTSASPYFTYGFNYRMDPNGSAQFKRSEMTAPANTIILAEEPEDSFPSTSGKYAASRHFGGGNFVLGDGHAQWITFQDWCRAGNPGCTNFFNDDNSTTSGDWKVGMKYHWFPYPGAPI
jgi:prepilin-type N-terminal cleavage/methylation domain-containing protein